jgi:hypothetical protein
LVQEDFDPSGYRATPEVELVLVQSKRTGGFSEDAINRLVSSCGHLLNLENALDQQEYRQRYNSSLLERVELFRSAYRGLMSQLPHLKVSVYYATEGDEVHPNVAGKVGQLETAITSLFSASELNLQFFGAAQLLALARRRPSSTSTMRISESIATSERANVNLVPLPELHRLLSDEDGRLRKDLFEANVRDYQGPTTVNKDIGDTLGNPQSEDFWWLNNGITVLATGTALAGKTLTLENVQIVNGLQTCAEIHKYFSSHPEQLAAEERQVLVRVIVPEDDGSRDLIIKATNSQTYMPVVSLRATDKLQRDIEDFFKSRGLYYDRRKNFYKNEGRPVGSIISIPFLAQAIMAIFLQQPDNSRARPSTLLKTDDAYSRVFNGQRSVEFYLACAILMRKCEVPLREHVGAEMRNNFRYQFAMLIAIALAGTLNPTVDQIIAAAQSEISDGLARLTLGFLLWTYEMSQDENLATFDKIAKSTASTTSLKSRLADYLKLVRGELEPWFEPF